MTPGIFMSAKEPGMFRDLSISLIFLSTAVSQYFITPINPAGIPEVILTPGGIHAWSRGRNESWIPWSKAPRVLGAVQRKKVIVGTGYGTKYEIPLAYLPMTCVHLERVISFYADNPDMRKELNAKEGVQRIRDLIS